MYGRAGIEELGILSEEILVPADPAAAAGRACGHHSGTPNELWGDAGIGNRGRAGLQVPDLRPAALQLNGGHQAAGELPSCPIHSSLFLAPAPIPGSAASTTSKLPLKSVGFSCL